MARLPGYALAARGIRKGTTRALRTSRVQYVDAQGQVLQRDGYSCVRCGHPAQQTHHRVPRGMGGSSRNPGTHNAARLISCCAECHRWIESERTQSTALGYLVPMGIDPATWPIRWRGSWKYLTDQGTTMPAPTPTEGAAQ